MAPINARRVTRSRILRKFSIPTVAHGYAGVGTEADFDIFGPTNTACN